MAGKTSGNLSLDAVAKAKRAIMMGKGLADKLKNLPSLNKGIKSASESSPHTRVPSSTPVLRVDALGREIDEHGNVISVTKPSNLSTLKVNINKQMLNGQRDAESLKLKVHVKDEWRRIRLDINKGHWSREEYQTLFDLVTPTLR